MPIARKASGALDPSATADLSTAVAALAPCALEGPRRLRTEDRVVVAGTDGARARTLRETAAETELSTKHRVVREMFDAAETTGIPIARGASFSY